MSSKLETKIEMILKANKIKFQREYSFKDLVGFKNVPLRFDFAVFKDNRLFLLIEADGEQHYKFIKHFYKSVFDFKRAQEWDRRKNKYCLSHKIPLIRIPYWDLESLTLKKILTEPSYIVKDKYHIDNLIRKR